MRALFHLNKYLWKYRYKLGLGIVFIIITNILAVYTPALVRKGFDSVAEILTEGNTIDGEMKARLIQGALFLALIYLGIYLVKGFFLFLTRQTIIVVSRLIEFDLKNEIFEQYQNLGLAFYKRNNTGDLMNRISEDVSKVRMYLGPAIMYTINLLLLFFLGTVRMLNINVELTLYVLAPLPILSVLIYYLSTVINKRSEIVQAQQSLLSTVAQESFSGVRVLKTYGRESFFGNAFKQECIKYKNKSLGLVKVDALFFPAILLLVGLSTILTVYIGGIKVGKGEVSMGNIAEFVIYVNMLTWPFASVGWVTSLVQRAAASQRRINEFLGEIPDIKSLDNALTEKVEGEIIFKDVSFTYPDTGVQALKNISFHLGKGENLAIIGRTGSGKSTVATLMARLYDVTQGEIRVDGHPLKEVNLDKLREAIGYVPQDVFLFSDTIYNNIGFGINQAEVTSELVEQVSDMASLKSDILEFKNGFDTMLGERGLTLSGGQKQRVSIARALLKNPRILILDDCLSAVDAETEENILKSLKQFMQDKTTILISHRVSTVKHAQTIIVLDKGQMVEKGDHKTLLNNKGVYYRLYQKQLLEEGLANK